MRAVGAAVARRPLRARTGLRGLVAAFRTTPTALFEGRAQRRPALA